MTGSNGLAKTYEQYIGDYETTTDPNDCRVWLWAMCDIRTLKVEFGTDLQSYCYYVSQRSAYVWFHNLKFDGFFIMDFLLKAEYDHVSQNPRRGEFATLISNMGHMYSITIHWRNGNKTEFRDSLKKLPMSVKAMSKAFNLEETKGGIDYHKKRPIGYVPTSEEYEYVTNDVVIVAKAIKNQISLGLTKLTVGADALSEYKSMIGKGLFEQLFPILPMEMDAEIRRAYRGGFTYADPRFARRITGAGSVYDVNSLYPYVMYTQQLPFGEPVFSFGEPKPTKAYPLWIANLTITAKLKPGHIPCIQIKGNSAFSGTEYQTSIDEPVSIACSNVDWELWIKHYDIDVHEYNGVFYFKAQAGMFQTYIDKWSKIKETSTGGIRTVAKLQLTSLYGKFGTNPNVTPRVPVLEEYDNDNLRVKLILGAQELREPVYTAMAVFVTAYARKLTITAAQAHYPMFAYADTDSLHLVGDTPVDLDIHPTKLGAWKHEYDFAHGYFLRAKAYTEQRYFHPALRHLPYDPFYLTEFETHIAGLPIEAARQVRFHHYQSGAVFGGKLAPRRVSGGVVLEDIGFTLKR